MSFFVLFLQFTLQLELWLCTIACFIKWIRYSLIWCNRWDCCLGEMLRVSGENQCHAIPHTPIKIPVQGRDLILLHYSCYSDPVISSYPHSACRHRTYLHAIPPGFTLSSFLCCLLGEDTPLEQLTYCIILLLKYSMFISMINGKEL